MKGDKRNDYSYERILGGSKSLATGKLVGLMHTTPSTRTSRLMGSHIIRDNLRLLHNKERVQQILFVVTEVVGAAVNFYAGAGLEHYGVACGGVPFHGGAEAWINISFAFGYEAEFQR